MGASLDWAREAYTLDEKREIGVRTAFKKMYDLGLIYRGHRVVNWDPKRPDHDLRRRDRLRRTQSEALHVPLADEGLPYRDRHDASRNEVRRHRRRGASFR